jgi:PTH1 family peptidyl-tRNA hydrolase
MFFVIGLGNPERRYAQTRHNVGFRVVDHLSQELRCSFTAGRGEYLIAHGISKGVSLALVKPLTFMNESGLAVMEICEEFGVAIEDLLIVSDDFQLPLGQLRLRLQGSDGGHNGLASVIYQVQSDRFPRLRCGIASSSMPSDKNLLAQFVLEDFAAEEEPQVRLMVERASEACLHAIAEGMTNAMNVFNKRKDSDQDSKQDSSTQ